MSALGEKARRRNGRISRRRARVEARSTADELRREQAQAENADNGARAFDALLKRADHRVQERLGGQA